MKDTAKPRNGHRERIVNSEVRERPRQYTASHHNDNSMANGNLAHDINKTHD